MVELHTHKEFLLEQGSRVFEKNNSATLTFPPSPEVIEPKELLVGNDIAFLLGPPPLRATRDMVAKRLAVGMMKGLPSADATAGETQRRTAIRAFKISCMIFDGSVVMVRSGHEVVTNCLKFLPRVFWLHQMMID
jgi:hypothetical protein